MKQFIFSILIFLFCGCGKEQAKTIQAEFDKIQNRWEVEAFQVSSNSGKNEIIMKQGEFLFEKCKYDLRGFEKKGTACSGECKINDTVYSIIYGYRYETRQYWFKLSPASAKSVNGVILKPGMEEYEVLQLMNGEWQIDVANNKLIAKQTKNDKLSNVQISFTAVSK
jgi:hypothetical protein